MNKEKNDIDWAGSWFPFMEDNGEFTKIVVIKTKFDQNNYRLSYIEHSKYDGVSTFSKLLADEGLDNIHIPTLKDSSPPNIIRHILNIIKLK